jgi:hypothetical protein
VDVGDFAFDGVGKIYVLGNIPVKFFSSYLLPKISLFYFRIDVSDPLFRFRQLT